LVLGNDTNYDFEGRYKMKDFIVRIKPLTPIWTGDANRKNTTLRETGIIGSLRWWYEALIRGLGGAACDPTDESSQCKLDHDKFYKAIKNGAPIQEALNAQICQACQLFGCTGWARKFKLEIEKLNEEIIFEFIPLREMEDVEWALLNKTITIISCYGAIGGKLAEAEYGVIKIEQNGLDKFALKKEELNNYLRKKVKGVDNPNLSRFIFVCIKDLNDKTFIEMKNNLSFLKGVKGKGKKYFYKTVNEKPDHLFVYAESDEEYHKIKEFLKKKSVQFTEGNTLLEGLR